MEVKAYLKNKKEDEIAFEKKDSFKKKQIEKLKNKGIENVL